MYKLCIALAFLAVAAAKPSWPLAYSGLNEFGYTYPAAYPYNTAYPYDAAYPYAAPLVKTVAPVAPIAPVVPLAYHAGVAPFGYPAEVPFIVKKK